MKSENLQNEKDSIKVKLENLGTINKNVVTICKKNTYLSLYFSYKTIIAFDKNGLCFMTDKKFSMTTSKFQNELKRKGFKEISEQEFQKKLSEVLKV